MSDEKTLICLTLCQGQLKKLVDILPLPEEVGVTKSFSVQEYCMYLGEHPEYIGMPVNKTPMGFIEMLVNCPLSDVPPTFSKQFIMEVTGDVLGHALIACPELVMQFAYQSTPQSTPKIIKHAKVDGQDGQKVDGQKKVQGDIPRKNAVQNWIFEKVAKETMILRYMEAYNVPREQAYINTTDCIKKFKQHNGVALTTPLEEIDMANMSRY